MTRRADTPLAVTAMKQQQCLVSTIRATLVAVMLIASGSKLLITNSITLYKRLYFVSGRKV